MCRVVQAKARKIVSAMEILGVTTGLRPDSQTMSKVGITMLGRGKGRVLYTDLVRAGTTSV